MAHKMLHEITIRVKLLRHLAQRFFQEEKERELLLAKAKSENSSNKSPGRRGVYRRCLRAEARIVDETRETGNSVWGKGMKVREAIWLRGADKLSWRLSERQFKRVKAYTPACKVHVYAVDASAPSMDTSDSVGWFVVDMRDIAGQRQHERWVKLQGASPAEVLVSVDLTMVREQSDSAKYSAINSWDQPSREDVEEGGTAIYEPKTDEMNAEGDAKLTAESDEESEMESKAETEPEAEAESKAETETEGEAESEAEAETEAEAEAAHPPLVGAMPEQEARDTPEDAEFLATAETEVVSELDALPVGYGADGNDARVFSLSISVKGASRLSGLAPHISDSDGAGFWFSYSIFGVVLQTERFEHLAAQPSEDEPSMDEPVLEPMLDSFRLRATLPGLCAFFGEAPSLQVYLCTTGRILAHADVDMSLLLPRLEWEGRNTSEFGRSGMEGNFVLRLPGEPVALGTTGRDDAVVTICAELTRAEVISAIVAQSETNDSLPGEVMAKQESRGNGRETPSVITWAQLAPEPQRQRLVVKATLDRLELAPLPGRIGVLGRRLGGVLVGIQSPQGASTLPTASGTTVSLPKEGFRLVGCGSDGGVKTEDRDVLGETTWEWEGDLCDHRGNALAEVHVLDPGEGDVKIATGMIPRPYEVCSGEQYMDVALWSSDGTKVGSCRVCLDTGARRGADDDRGDDELNAVRIQGGPAASVSFPEEESKLEDSQEAEQGGEDGEAVECQAPSAAMNVGATVSEKGVQAEEAPLGREQDEAWGRVPRSYRLSINLASVKDFENAANVVAYYHYPHFGTSAPVRTSLAWVAPRMDTPLSNSCCTFSFGMSFDRLASTARDHKLVVSIRNKDRFQEQEVGLATVPLEELVKSEPRYFRCRDTNKTFTSRGGFRAHLEARQRSGGISAQEASRSPPVGVKVLDSYLTVVSTIGPPASSSFPPGGSSGPPSKLCSLRVSLLLEDMGPTEHPRDEKIPDGLPNAQSAGLRTMRLGNVSTMPPALEELRSGMGEGGADLERVWRKWERWRIAEETGFVQRLREKDRALEAKWEARENVRRRDLTQAQTDYGKLEAKLRKALSEIEARERALKAKEESWRSEHAQKLSELGLQQRRLREETRHQVVLERMKTKSLEKQLASQTKQLEDARARVTAADEDLERFKEKQRKTSEGRLRQELLLLGAAKAEAESQVERERNLKMKALLEKEEYRAHIHKLARALKRHQERESTCARREMEQLRLEYLAREERFMLDGDRNELRTMKQELHELRHLGLVQEAQASLENTNSGNIPATSTSARNSNPRTLGEGDGNGGRTEGGIHGDAEAFFVPGPSPLSPPQPMPAPAQVRLRLDRSAASRRSGSEGTNVANKTSGVSGVARRVQGEGQVESLVEWRDCLLGTGIYTEQNPIVSELNHWIGAGGGQGRVARGEGWREK